MAKAPAKQEAPAAAAAPKKGKKKKLLIILVGLLLVLVLGGGATLFVLKKRQAREEGLTKDSSARNTKPEAPPVFVRMESFTVKLQPDSEKQEQYLQAVPELRVLDASVGDKIKLYMPEIRFKTLLLLSSKKPSELSTPQGVEKLSYELRNQINQILSGGVRPAGAGEPSANAGPGELVQAVLFTSFIIQ